MFGPVSQREYMRGDGVLCQESYTMHLSQMLGSYCTLCHAVVSHLLKTVYHTVHMKKFWGRGAFIRKGNLLEKIQWVWFWGRIWIQLFVQSLCGLSWCTSQLSYHGSTTYFHGLTLQMISRWMAHIWRAPCWLACWQTAWSDSNEENWQKRR